MEQAYEQFVTRFYENPEPEVARLALMGALEEVGVFERNFHLAQQRILTY